jgi:hypothetical protein
VRQQPALEPRSQHHVRSRRSRRTRARRAARGRRGGARVVAREDEQLLDAPPSGAVRGSAPPRPARAGGGGASRRRSTCSATRTSATGTRSRLREKVTRRRMARSLWRRRLALSRRPPCPVKGADPSSDPQESTHEDLRCRRERCAGPRLDPPARRLRLRRRGDDALRGHGAHAPRPRAEPSSPTAWCAAT